MDTLITTLSAITPDRIWGIDIPNYFWFTGSSAAAFIISSFAHVFGMEKYKPIAGFSLLMALVLLIAAPLNLIDDLSQPGRLANFFLYGWENFPTSPMKWGVLLLMAYPILIFFEALVLYRPYFVKKMNFNKGIKRKIYSLLSLGRTQLNSEETAKDHKYGFILGSVGIPLALCVHGYTGYILGAVHGNYLWSTPLMPILFLASAMVSGTGLLIILIPIFQKFFTTQRRVDKSIIAELAKLLAWFIVIDLTIRALWLSFAIPFGNEPKNYLLEFFTMHFNITVYIEYILCLIIPMIIGFSKLRHNLPLVFITGIVVAMGVWLFRWSTVIGGQTIPRSMPGFLEYSPHMIGQGSITAIIANWLFFIALVCLVTSLFPWDEEMEEHYNDKGLNHE